jgi:thiamine biosynthesis protein ThiS
MELLINGQPRTFPTLVPGASVAQLVAALELKGDRVAIEHNGVIVRRPQWSTTLLSGGDRMEIVHFVGGGSSPHLPCAATQGWPY